MEIINIRKLNLNKLGYRDLEHWLENKNHIYIGRNMSFYVKGANKSKWFNPFTEKKHGRYECLELYKNYLLKSDDLINNLSELKGKVLGCWRKPNKCHGDIILELVNKKHLISPIQSIK